MEETLDDEKTLVFRGSYLQKLPLHDFKAQGQYAEAFMEKIPGRDKMTKHLEDFYQRQASKVFNYWPSDN